MEQLSFLHIALVLLATGVIIFGVTVFTRFFKKFMLDEPASKLLNLIWVPIIPLLLSPVAFFIFVYLSSGASDSI